MTQDYRIILPIMLCCGISALLYRTLSKESINTMKLARHGIHLRRGRDVNLMRSVLARDAMPSPVDTVRKSAVIGDVIKLMRQTRHSGFPVIDEEDCLVGMITLEDIRPVDVKVRLTTLVGAVMARDLITAVPQETLEQASRKLALREIGRLPVVDAEDPRKVLGIITMSDIVRSYNRCMLQGEESVG